MSNEHSSQLRKADLLRILIAGKDLGHAASLRIGFLKLDNAEARDRRMKQQVGRPAKLCLSPGECDALNLPSTMNSLVPYLWRRMVCIRVAVLLVSSFATGAEPQPELLWPNGPPDSNGLEGPEIVKACIGNISIPTVTVFPAPKETATGAAVVVIPGGGYGVVCVGPEGMPIVRELNQRGITAVLLKYRLPNQHHEIPANDARRAIRLTRANAADWGVDPNKVGVWGFSAGGHLASRVSIKWTACGERK